MVFQTKRCNVIWYMKVAVTYSFIPETFKMAFTVIS